jgi:diaminopimelate epimerase
MRSSRWDAQGNIYLVTEEPQTEHSVRADVGDADGVLEVLRHGDDWLEITIWNPDGSRAEMSGNGTRIAARWLAERSDAGQIVVRVGPREVATRLLPGGRAEQDLGEVAVSPPEEVAGVTFVAVDVGNPHAVVDGDPAELPRIGPLLEMHERFPQRTNVQVARIVGEGEIEARVWERGVGETASSGSSAVAVAAAFGRSPAVIRFPGGILLVRFERDRAFLTGPAVRL